MSEWSEAALGDLLEIVIDHRGKTPKKLGGTDFAASGIPVISAIHIKDGRINWSERKRYVERWLFEKWMPNKLRQGDVLLTSEAPLGEVAQVPRDEDLVLSQRLFALRGAPELLDSTFLRYFLASSTGRSRLLARASGTTVLGIRQSELLKVRVPAPPVAEQRRIAEVLAALDALIEINLGLVQNLWETAECVFTSAALGGEEVSLGSAISLRYGKALPANRRIAGPYPVVSSAGVTGSHTTPLVEGPGVVVGRKGTVGSVTWVNDDFFPIDTTFYAETELPMLYAYFALRAAGLGDLNTDSAVPGLNRANALQRRIRVPDSEALESFMRLAGGLVDAAHTLELEASELSATLDELLPLLMSGKVRVKDLEGVA